MPTAQFPSPLFSKSKVNWAGKILCDDSADPSSVAQANVIIDDWRASHRRPLTHMNVHLRNLAKSVRRNPVIAQRLKRTPSIRHKLERIPKMQLSRMQDRTFNYATSTGDGEHDFTKPSQTSVGPHEGLYQQPKGIGISEHSPYLSLPQ